jgi:hypothetical protein
MKRTFTIVLAALSLTLSATAFAIAVDAPTTLKLHTQDDDLRAGGMVSFVLRMDDGVEQAQVVVDNTALGGWTSKEATVQPKPPYDWARVRDFGIRVKLHPGDGLLLQRDQWKVYVVLMGIGGGCTATSWLPPGESCFTNRNLRLHFTSDLTHWEPLRARVGKCTEDASCNGRDFCAARAFRCAPTAAGSDTRGCLRLPTPQPACGAGLVCDEGRNRCTTPECAIDDRDGDGAASPACGGSDCDDNDNRRYPGATEICDGAGHDEDCDARTFGHRDADGDGHPDAACWNDGRQF